MVPRLRPCLWHGVGRSAKNTNKEEDHREEEGTRSKHARGWTRASLAGLPLEATVALADVAGAVKEGLLGFCADVGLMVMAQMLDEEMTARVGAEAPPRFPAEKRTGMARPPVRWCWAVAK